METKTGKQIVSKSMYVQRQADRALVGVFSLCFCLVALLCALFALGGCLGLLACLWFAYLSGHLMQGVGMACACLFWIVLTGGGAYFLYTISSILMKDVVETDPGVPFTRANTADLPAPQSLVRAASAPNQEQQAVLLRAAAEGWEQHVEQLVRPAGGQEQP